MTNGNTNLIVDMFGAGYNYKASQARGIPKFSGMSTIISGLNAYSDSDITKYGMRRSGEKFKINVLSLVVGLAAPEGKVATSLAKAAIIGVTNNKAKQSFVSDIKLTDEDIRNGVTLEDKIRQNDIEYANETERKGWRDF